MRKALYFLSVLLTFGAFTAMAQGPTYHCVTATTGTQTISGVTTTVTQSSPAPNSGTYCTAGPYQIGKDYSDYYNYTFAGPNGGVTHVRLQMARIHDFDTVRVYVNGAAYDLGNATQSAFAGGGCGLTSGNIIVSGTAGEVTTVGTITGPGDGVEFVIDIAPARITSLRVENIRAASNTQATDVYYNMCFADDICFSSITATAQTPACSGRDVQLEAPMFAGATYAWTYTGPSPIPPTLDNANIRDPKILNAPITATGGYAVAVTLGGCVLRDTVFVNMDQTPQVTNIRQGGPKCVGEADSVYANPSLATGGLLYAERGGVVTSEASNFWFPVPVVASSDAQPWRIWAVSTAGCSSDTQTFFFKVHPEVIADFTWTVDEGCDEDTVHFTDASTGGNTSSWFFDDPAGSTSTDKNPTFRYPVPAIDTVPRIYNVRYIAGNGLCLDTIVKNVTIDHPIKAFFTINKDSVCQGEEVVFTNTSRAKAGTAPDFLWTFGDGNTDVIYNTTHTYIRAGKFTSTIKVTDFRGCVREFSRDIVVDSAGGIVFIPSREEVCVGEEIVFTGDFSAAGYITAVWDFEDGVVIPDSTVLHHSFNDPGVYNVKFDIDYRICPDTSFEKAITVKPYPKVYIGEDTTICPNGRPFVIQDQVNVGGSPDVKYKWNTPVGETSQGILVRGPGVYSVTADLNGCTATDSITIKKDCYINIPNVFTPNGDGRGDYFLPRQLLSSSVTKFDMQIYNRWGEIVFETNATNGRGWDGKYGSEDQPNGVYIYSIKAEFSNGNVERYQGNVTLLR